jgi:hypothetical protein
MLVHFFCLLEFKFKFEFHYLNPFQTQTLIPKPSTSILPSSPTQQQACAAAHLRQPAQPLYPPSAVAQQPACACAQPSKAAGPFPRARPTSFVPLMAQLAHQPPPARAASTLTVVADQGDPLVIPELGSSPTRTRPRRRLGVRAPHASSAWPARKAGSPGLYKPSAAPWTAYPPPPEP